MDSANIKMLDQLSGLSPKSKSQPTANGDSHGKSTETAFATLFGDLVGGLMPVMSDGQEIQMPQSNQSESPLILSKSNEMQLLENGRVLNQVQELAPEQVQPASNNKSDKNLATLIELLNAKTTANDNSTMKLNDLVVKLKGNDKLNTQGKNTPTAESNKYAIPGTLDGFKSAFELPAEVKNSSLVNENLTKLNVKEIKVKSHQDNTGSIEKQLTFDLIAVKVKEQLDNNIIAQNRPNNQASATVVSSDTESAENENDFLNMQSKSDPKSDKKLISTQINQDETATKFDSITEKSNHSGQNKIEQNTIVEMKTATAKSSDQLSSTLDSANKTVKVIIPESAKLNSTQQHQSIMIRIEPEHLGPARLELQLKHDIFSAKLTVDTVEAKAVLEHSIHSLKEQLARVDIKVEQIEINVRGEANHNQMFDKQPQWQKHSQINQFRFSNEELNEQFIPTNSTFIPQSLQFVNDSGVNVLA